MLNFIKDEHYTNVNDDKPDGTIHSYTVLFTEKTYCGRKHVGYKYSAYYHEGYGFANASFSSDELLSEDIAKERLHSIYKNTNYVQQPYSID